MARGVHRHLGRAATAAAVLALAGCSLFAGSAATPPTITQASVVSSVDLAQDFVRFTYPDGHSADIPPLAYRQLTPGGWGGIGGLVILGSDQAGGFVASYLPQGGLPADCYVENARGVERGRYIETRGGLWAKAAGFQSPLHPGDGSAYPTGTRFCFNTAGQVASVVAP